MKNYHLVTDVYIEPLHTEEGIAMQKQILIVEDNALNREILYEILADQYSVLQAENGSAALKILYQYRDSIALILLDVMMPVMDGYTFLDRVKEDN